MAGDEDGLAPDRWRAGPPLGQWALPDDAALLVPDDRQPLFSADAGPLRAAPLGPIVRQSRRSDPHPKRNEDQANSALQPHVFPALPKNLDPGKPKLATGLQPLQR